MRTIYHGHCKAVNAVQLATWLEAAAGGHLPRRRRPHRPPRRPRRTRPGTAAVPRAPSQTAAAGDAPGVRSPLAAAPEQLRPDSCMAILWARGQQQLSQVTATCFISAKLFCNVSHASQRTTARSARAAGDYQLHLDCSPAARVWRCALGARRSAAQRGERRLLPCRARRGQPGSIWRRAAVCRACNPDGWKRVLLPLRRRHHPEVVVYYSHTCMHEHHA